MTEEETRMQLKIIMQQVDDLQRNTHNRVTREEFEPIKKITMGIVFAWLLLVLLVMIITALPHGALHAIVRFFQ